ncbi:transporter substrate-binding domain-containing protein [Roseovarius arcticus]|uniref:transporter substrate-binding domain-containing protein n=1 Tax=Roseovarius arcticus TaxID=2547404 RepID=UPI001FE33890|nr:transporter substrate-binding domain-containing protein [Roseovarius arcticus]
MKNLTKRMTQIVGALAVVIAACSAGSSAQAESTWDAIQDRGTLRLGVTQSPPWYSKDARSGEWTGGLGVSIGKNMAETLGVELEPVEVTWGTAIAALEADKIDIMFVMDATPARAMVVDFPKQPLLYISLAVLANDGVDASTWKALDKPEIKIAVPQATSMDDFLTRNVPNADIQRFPDNATAIAAFQSGRVDAVSLFHPPLLSAWQKLGRGQVVIPTPAFSSPSSAAVRREDDKTFRDWVDNTIFYYYETGRTQRWYEEFLADFGLDPAKSPPIQRELLFKQ